MSEPRAIAGDYADFKLIKTRQVCQIVVEVPLEDAEKVTRLLGFPRPGAGTRCAIALIDIPGAGASTAARERVGDASTREDEGLGHSVPVTSAKTEISSIPTRTNSQRAAFLLKNPDFRRFLSALAGDTPPTVTTEAQADQNLKAHFGISSKSDLDHMDAGWGALLGMFKAFQQAQGHGVI